MILSGELAPGTRLPPERDLAARFNVSRPTLREAIHVLEALDLLEVRPGGGTYVSKNPSPLTSHGLEQMLQRDYSLMLEMVEVRREFEVRNAELAATQATDAEIERLGAILSAMEGDIAAGREDFERDIEFHLEVAEASHNRVRRFITRCVLLAHFEMLREARIRILRRQRQLVGDFLREHRDIHLAIKDRSPERARTAMLIHLNAAYSHYLALQTGHD